MTELAEVLQEASDTVFTVRFHKKVTEEHVISQMEAAAIGDFSNQQSLNKLVKSMLDGEICQMQCYLVNCDNELGRSTVIDLTAKGDNKFRQVDHRTIEYIIIRNKKYILKKGGKKVAVEDEEMDDGKKKEPKWDFSQLTVGTWFSGTRYFRSVEEQKG